MTLSERVVELYECLEHARDWFDRLLCERSATEREEVLGPIDAVLVAHDVEALRVAIECLELLGEAHRLAALLSDAQKQVAAVERQLRLVRLREALQKPCGGDDLTPSPSPPAERGVGGGPEAGEAPRLPRVCTLGVYRDQAGLAGFSWSFCDEDCTRELGADGRSVMDPCHLPDDLTPSPSPRAERGVPERGAGSVG